MMDKFSVLLNMANSRCPVSGWIIAIFIEAQPLNTWLGTCILVDVNQKADKVFTKTNMAVCHTLSAFCSINENACS